MRGLRRGQDGESPELKTPATIKEQLNSHPLDVDSDSEASFASALDNQGDFDLSPGVLKALKFPQSLSDGADTEHRVKQQASSQTADFIAAHTPTSLTKAQGMGASVQSLAHQVAFAAAKRANTVSRDIEAAADTGLDQPSTATQDNENENAVDLMQNRGNTPSKPTGSLADITNSTYNKQTHMTNKMTSQDGMESPAAMLMQTAATKSAVASSHLTLVFDWTLSTLYFSSGVAAAVAVGIARGISARH